MTYATLNEPTPATALLAEALELYREVPEPFAGADEKVARFRQALMLAAVFQAQEAVEREWGTECACWTDGFEVIPSAPESSSSWADANRVQTRTDRLLQEAGVFHLKPASA